jgi:protein-tyrosine phosphatase
MADNGQARRMLLVCTANVCRSFMAEAVVRARIIERRLPLTVGSAATRLTDLPVDPDAVIALAEMGFALPGHQPRQIDRDLIRSEGADLIITMTREHLRDVVATDRLAWPRTFTLKELVRRASVVREPATDWESWLAAVGVGRSARELMAPDVADDIPDPYGTPLAAHRESLVIIRSLIDQVLSLSPLPFTGL